MAKQLVVVESPAKARTINRILGGAYTVRASMGHVRDLPERRLGVRIEDGFRPDYETLPDRAKTVRELQAAARGVASVYLAPDQDREGEAIAWHLKAVLAEAEPKARFVRVTYNEITAPAIRRAFEQPGEIDENKVNAQQARRILDRLVGYKVSKIVARQVRGGSSAGRVQSVALRLVCEREAAIEGFTPEEYWLIGARVAKQVDPRDPFEVRLARIDGEKAHVGSSEAAARVRKDLEKRDLRVAAVHRRELRRRPMPPFITSTLQQAASSVCGFSPSRTMRIAQGLYEGVDLGSGPVGLITYMRTDSVAIAATAQEAARAVIAGKFGADYLPPKPPAYRSRAAAQEAHEAIRPTDPARLPEDLAARLTPEQAKLYRLIWQRFLASQMAPAVIARRTAEIEAVPPAPVASDSPVGEVTAYLFRATASEVLFPGHLRVTGEGGKGPRRRDDGERGAETEEEIEALPPLEPGEMLDLKEWTEAQKFTQPPARYSEASLVRALEANGIGRPSTYAQTLATLQNRKYVAIEKRQLRPTETGRAVNAFLTDRLDALFNVRFTAEMEEDLDRVERGEVEWTAMLARFYEAFDPWLRAARAARVAPGQVDRLLAALEGVREWAPERRRGKRVYSDREFVASLRAQVAEGKALTERQVDALRKTAWRYRDQVPALVEDAAGFGLDELSEEDRKAGDPPRDETKAKLELLRSVEFDPPRTVRDRTYDDAAFVSSLREQVESGKRLSERQVQTLDTLVQRYGPRIEGFAEMRERLGLASGTEGEGSAQGAAIEALLRELEAVTEWKPPVTKGKRVWNDREFFESLREQYRVRRSLSPRQVAALGRMAARYRRGGSRRGEGKTAGD